MSKINLVLHDTDWTSFRSVYLEDIFDKFFNRLFFDKIENYDKKSTLFIAGYNTDSDWIQQLKNQGYKVAIDNLWSTPAPDSKNYCITNLNWFWYNDCLLYIHEKHHQYVPSKTYSKKALMPLNKSKLERQLLITKLSDILDDLLYSYNGIRLPGDSLGGVNPYYFNPQWYDDTYFSIVAETVVFDFSEYTRITEKTFKPIAFYHPFVILAQPNTLAYLKSLGFETYNNLFDESYDTIVDGTERLLHLISQIKQFVKKPYDAITLEKLEHNHNLFFDSNLVKTRIYNELIVPLINYVET